MKKVEKDRLFEAVDFSKTGLVKAGTPINDGIHIEKIPPMEELFNGAIARIENANFKVSRVCPVAANAILRVFRNKSLKACREEHWIYGTKLYLFDIGFCGQEGGSLEYDIFEIQKYLYSDESVILKPDFVDYYLQII